MVKYRVTLTAEERAQLQQMSRKAGASRKMLNALILLGCDEGEHQERKMKNEDIATVLKVSMRRIDRLKRCFIEHGLEVALEGRKSERVYERKADGDFEAHLVALSCGAPPEGFERWSLRLLANRAVELKYVESVSYETVRRVLKKTRSSRGKSKAG